MLIQIGRRIALVVFGVAAAGLGMAGPAQAGKPAMQSEPICSQFSLEVKPPKPLAPVTLPPTQECHVGMSNGFPIPDPACTPGGIDLNLTRYVLRNPAFRTSCIRMGRTSERKKNLTLGWYAIPLNADKTATAQACVLDHLVPLELGGTDALYNIWPECAPAGIAAPDGYLATKDIVGRYLLRQVKRGDIELADAQEGIAKDWTQYLEAAKAACPGGDC